MKQYDDFLIIAQVNNPTSAKTRKPLTLSAMVKKAKVKTNMFDEDVSDEESLDESDDDSGLNEKKTVEKKYDLETVLKYLQNGYYIRYDLSIFKLKIFN